MREAHCLDCKAATEMIHLWVADEADIRRCGECGAEIALELLVYVQPSEVTHPGDG
ncbi:hypothetical protein [Streptomyces rimosus]|uniref:hypothetical protein n=1 Tax=Streptomyces rimosus TaxID=1927 RepID=UPI000AED0AC7|nr:hypothetical protein [Streptomyces rimosus]